MACICLPRFLRFALSMMCLGLLVYVSFVNYLSFRIWLFNTKSASNLTVLALLCICFCDFVGLVVAKWCYYSNLGLVEAEVKGVKSLIVLCGNRNQQNKLGRLTSRRGSG